MTPATLDLGSTLLHYDLILTNYICKDFVSKKKEKDPKLRFQEERKLRGGEHYSTHYKRCTRKGGGFSRSTGTASDSASFTRRLDCRLL